jgi:hypothetical protein
MRGATVIAWSSTGSRTVTGQAPTEEAAWRQTANAAVELLRESPETKCVLLRVNGAEARLYPAIDEHGQYDETRTQAMASRLIEDVENELQL